MSKSTIIKIFMGFICSLLIIVGAVWFLVYQQHQDRQGDIPQTAEKSAEELTKGSGDEPSGEELIVTTTKLAVPTETPVPFDASRLANPMKEVMVPSDLAKSLGITKENYPRIDGSTSTFGLSERIYWEMFLVDENIDDYHEDIGEPKAPAKTIPSYKNLIAGDVDLILVPDPSQAVKDLEKEADVELEYIPIGVEGLVFITYKNNPVSNVTIEQINQIYADMTITNWSQLGGTDGEILALCRNSDSGSQAQFDNLVMGEGKTVNPKIQEKYTLDDMSEMLWAVSGVEPLWIEREEKPSNHVPLGYSVYYYVNMAGYDIARNIKILTVNGIMPTDETIASKEYPLAMGYFAVIRKDTPQDAPARILANWLTTSEGQRWVATAGLGEIPVQ